MSDPGHVTPHLLVIEARFYEDIADTLYQGASAALDAGGVTHERVSVPGVFEIPAVVRMAVRSMDFFAGRRRFDGYVALGCVIRGETTHYELVSGESCRGLMDLGVRHGHAAEVLAGLAGEFGAGVQSNCAGELGSVGSALNRLAAVPL